MCNLYSITTNQAAIIALLVLPKTDDKLRVGTTLMRSFRLCSNAQLHLKVLKG